MNTTPIEKCSIGPDAELTVRLATEKGWSRFLIFPNGNLIGTSPDGIEDEPVPNFGRILKDAAPDLLAALESLLTAHRAYHVAAQAEVIGAVTAEMLFEKDNLVIEARAATFTLDSALPRNT